MTPVKYRSISARILFLSILLSALLLSSWTFWSFQWTYNTLLTQKRSDLQVLLKRNADYLTLYSQGLNSNLLSLANTLESTGMDEDGIQASLLAFQRSNPGKVHTLYCAIGNGRVFCTRAAQYEVFGNEQVLRCLESTDGSSYQGIRWSEPYISPLNLQRTIALYKPIELDSQHGIVLMELNLATMLSSILSSAEDVSLIWYVLSEDGQLVATSDDYAPPRQHKSLTREVLEVEMPAMNLLPVGASRFVIADREYLFYRKNAVCMGWSLGMFIPEATLVAAVRPLIYTVMLTGSVHLVLLSTLAALLTHRTMRPVISIGQQIYKTDNPLSLTFEPYLHRRDEVGVLSRSLTDMIARINLLNQRQEQIQSEKRRLEMDVLQAQIHPHFLSNTLSCIQSLVKENKSAEAQQSITALIRLMNYSIGRTDDVVYLQDELACAQAYVDLRRMRTANAFEYAVYVPVSHCRQIVPRLFLQPIIENSIVHGFSGVPGPHLLTVTSYEQNGKLFICVDDNGKGADADHLRAVMEGRQKPSTHSCGIGVTNVFKRLQLTHPEATESTMIPMKNGVRVILDLGYYRPNTDVCPS